LGIADWRGLGAELQPAMTKDNGCAGLRNPDRRMFMMGDVTQISVL